MKERAGIRPFIMVKLFITKVDINSIKEINKLSDYRRAKAERIIHEKDRAQSVTAGLLLEKFLKEKMIKIGEYGKPYIEYGPEFNLAHSGDYVLLALGDTPVGCDIEQMKDADYLRLGRLVYTEGELNALRESDDARSLFYEFWTKKEAYMKLAGEGFHLSPKSLDFSSRENEFVIDGKSCFFKEYMLDGYKIMLCTREKTDCELEYVEL